MNIKKHFKKFILVFVVLILFNFCCPKRVHALELVEDLLALPARILFWMEKGVLTVMNDIFANDDHKAREDTEVEEYDAISLRIYLTPETIIKGKFILLDANIFKNIDQDNDYYDYDEVTNGTDRQGIVGGKSKLRGIISGWYYALRNFAIVALLSVLVYVGIRMVISTLAQDKAKYKTMFKDWLVALCLLIAMNYIMIGTLQLSSMITDAIGSSGSNVNMIGKITEIISGVLSESSSTDENGNDHWLYRFYIYKVDTDGDGQTDKTYDIGDAYAYILVLMGIIIFTIIFAIKYLKREFTIIFLVLLGPISCITYPIDKVGDGKAQAFNRWLSEFIYQVIIQPFHLLLYVVLVGSAVELADTNVIYALVSFGVMIPAEKFIKQMFGFKDSLGSPLGNMMKAGLARDMLNRATSRFMGGKGGTSGAGGKNGVENNSLPPNPATKPINNNLLGGGNGTESQAGNSNIRLNNNPSQGENTQTSDSNQIDLERAEAFRNARAEGLSQEEALDRVNEELPLDRNDSVENNLNNLDLEDVPEIAGDAAGIATLEESEGGSERINGETEGDRTQENQERQRQLNEALQRQNEQENYEGNWRSIHAQRMANKYGTTSRKKRNLKRAGKVAKGVLKGTGKLAKIAAFAGAAGVAASYAALTGNGAEALAIAAGAAGIIANKGKNSIKGVAKNGARFVKSAAKDYHRNDAIPLASRLANNTRLGQALGLDRDSRAFSQFESDPDQQRRAIMAYRKNHDGENPDYEQLRKEMQDRFELAKYGLTNDQIDNSIGSYQALRESEYERLNESGEDTPENIAAVNEMALMQTAFAANLADRYSAKDFGSEKSMKEAVQTIADRFQNAGVADRSIAEANARKYLQQAAEIKKTDMVKLPEQTQNVDINTQNQTMPSWVGSLGVDANSLTEENIEQITRLNVRVHETGLDEGQLRLLASGVDRSGGTSRVIANFENKIETSVEYLSDSNRRNEARQYLESTRESNSRRRVTEKEIDTEMKERLVLSDRFDVKKKEDLDKVRTFERREKIPKTQKQLAREMAVKSKGLSSGEKSALQKKLVKDLTDGGASRAQASKDAENIMELANRYNNYQPTE